MCVVIVLFVLLFVLCFVNVFVVDMKAGSVVIPKESEGRLPDARLIDSKN